MKFRKPHTHVNPNLTSKSEMDFTEEAHRIVKKAKLAFFRLSQL